MRVLSRLFRRLYLEQLQSAFDHGKLSFVVEIAELSDAERFAAYLAPLHRAEWVVYAKPPFGGSERVLEYLGRYTHRVALSNDRILAADETSVVFQWNDYRAGAGRAKSRTMRLESAEFLRRFLKHVLPDRFQRIRHLGFLANRHRRQKLALCRRLLGSPITELLPDRQTCAAALAALAPPAPRRCPVCGVGEMVRIGELPAYRWPARPPDTS